MREILEENFLFDEKHDIMFDANEVEGKNFMIRRSGKKEELQK